MTKETKETEKKDIVEIPAPELKRLQDDLRETKEMLLAVADKRQLSTWFQRNKGKIPQRVSLRTWQGKVVLGWQSTVDISHPDPVVPQRWVEDQQCVLILEDGTQTKSMPQIQFTRDYKQVEAEVIGKIENAETGELAIRVRRTDNAKEYTIDIRYVN